MAPSSREDRWMHPNVTRVAEAAAALDLDLTHAEFPEGTRTAAEAAAAIGVEVGQIVKSLVFLLDGQPVMALVSGSNRLDEARLAEALGGATVQRADAGAVRAATGYAIGGVPPFGHRSVLPVAIDEDLLGHDELWAAAGTPRDVFAITPDALITATGGRVVRLRADA
jgi:Cys-tRNA(Pro) deacylase